VRNLITVIWNALLNAGLEPYCGFLHTTRAGKPSLVLDIMEEYRAWVVDRTVATITSLCNLA
jgi:CRISPR-associated protein Cas1